MLQHQTHLNRETTPPPSSQHTLVAQPNLPISIYRLCLRALDPIRLPPFSGSTWRGVFGHALRSQHCVTGAPNCKNCPVLHTCTYAQLFETPVPPQSQRMRLYPHIPRPFLVKAASPHQETNHRRDSLFHLDLALFGRANQLLPAIALAFQRAGAAGVGRNKARFQAVGLAREAAPGSDTWLSQAWDQPLPAVSPAIPQRPDRLKVVLDTPLRLIVADKLVEPETFSFGDFFGSLLRRITNLMYFYTPNELDTDFSALMSQAHQLPIQRADLQLFDQQRYSSRHQRKLPTSGLMGEFQLEGEDWAPFWPYLWLGASVHAGKGTVMGLGRYHLEIPFSLPKRKEV